MGQLVDIGARFGSRRSLRHPAGPVLPLDGEPDFALIGPELRSAFVNGHYCRDQITCLQEALRPGDRVLDVGSDLGVAAAVAMRSGHASRVIAIEADPRLIKMSARLLRASGAEGVELVHGVPAVELSGTAKLLLRRDPRRSSLRPLDGPWWGSSEVPLLSLNLILSEVRINLLMLDPDSGGAALTACPSLYAVDRILVSRPQPGRDCEALAERLEKAGFSADELRSAGPVTLFRRTAAAERLACPAVSGGRAEAG